MKSAFFVCKFSECISLKINYKAFQKQKKQAMSEDSNHLDTDEKIRNSITFIV